MKRFIFCAVLIILSAFTACENDMFNDAFNDNKSKVKYYGYVIAGTSLYSNEVLEDGSFKQIGAPVTGLTSPQRISVHPSGDFIYVAASGSILCYKTGDDGALTPLAPLVNGIVNYDMVIHPSGKYLYAISRVAPNINIYSINPDGTLINLGTILIPGTTSCAIAINLSGSKFFLSYTNGTSSYLESYTISDNGNLTYVTSISYGDSSRVISMAVHQSMEYLYAVFNGTDVKEFNINSNGSLTQITLINLLWANDVKVSTTAKNIYITPYPASVASLSYGILNTGTLYKISDNNTLPAAAQNYIEVHPNGKYVYTTESSGTYKSLICYTAELNGSLTYKSLTADCSPSNPLHVKICGKTVYGN